MDETAVKELLGNSVRILASRYVSEKNNHFEEIVSKAVLRLLRANAKRKQNNEIWWNDAFIRNALSWSLKNWHREQLRLRPRETEPINDEYSRGSDPDLDLLIFEIALKQVVESLPTKDQEFFTKLKEASFRKIEDAELALEMGMRTSTFSSRKLVLLKKIMAGLNEQP